MGRKKILIGLGRGEVAELVEGYVVNQRFGIARTWEDRRWPRGAKFLWAIIHLNTSLIITRATTYTAARKFVDQISRMPAFDEHDSEKVKSVLQERGIPPDVMYVVKAMHDTDRVLYTNPFSWYEER